MASVDATATANDGVTLVTVQVVGDGIARRIRVEQRLDGPVWPPRREGRPEPGWDDAGYEGVVPADGRLVLGYATPAPPAPEPVSVEEGEAVPEDEDGDDTLGAPDAVLQRLGDPAPPRDAVALPETDGSVVATDRGEDTTRTSRGSGEDAPVPTDDRTSPPHGASPPVDPVTGWLDRVEQRVATVERLEAIQTVPEATRTLESVGGIAGGRRAVRATDADRRRLLAVATRARRLAERIEATDPPLSTLESFR
jgi:hypothetical protein